MNIGNASRVRPAVGFPALALLLFLALWLPASSRYLHGVAPSAAAQVPIVPSGKSHAVQAATLHSCVPLNFPTPAALDLDNQPTGANVQVDQPTYYQIYGTTADQLRTQIQRCAPDATSGSDAEYTGVTSYRLSWLYDITATSNACSLSNVRVGLHTATALPQWQPGASTTRLAAQWQTFIAGLALHEKGHVAIDRTSAVQLVGDLRAISNTPCGSINSLVQQVVRNDSSALVRANDNYDNATDHGATQGAVLPVR